VTFLIPFPNTAFSGAEIKKITRAARRVFRNRKQSTERSFRKKDFFGHGSIVVRSSKRRRPVITKESAEVNERAAAG
jgi:hypothetical protein